MAECGVYIIRCKTTGKVYVGSALNFASRWNTHRAALVAGTHYNLKLQRAWNKYGAEDFEFEPIIFCTAELFFHEQIGIECLNAVDEGYNIARIAGSSMAERKHTEQTKLAMSLTRKGRKQNPEWVAKRLAWHKDQPISEEQKNHISATLEGRPASPGTARNLRKIAASRTPEYTAWLGRKGAASRWGHEFNEPKPTQLLIS
jgi:group I intron endonuclease